MGGNPVAPLLRNYIQKNSFATKPLRHKGMICMLNHQINYGSGTNKFYYNLSALVSLWLNK